MHFKPKLIAFDLDGTLAESKQPVSVETGELLAQLLAHIPVAVMSGAGYTQMERQFLPAFPGGAHLEHLYLFPNSAARCYRYQDGAWKSEYDHSFDPFERGRIMQAIKEALEEVGLSEVPNPVWGERIEDRGAQISFSPLGQQAPVDAKREWNRLYDHKRKELHATLTKRLPDFSVKMGGLTTIDITHKGINKAYGIRQLVKFTDISVAEMLYVGDALQEGGNDSVVVDTGVHTHEVFGPEETIALIKDMLRHAHNPPPSI